MRRRCGRPTHTATVPKTLIKKLSEVLIVKNFDAVIAIKERSLNR